MSQKDLRNKKELYKKYIFFEVINGIFGGTRGGKRDLVVKIYERLNDLLSTDFQFNHQRAKCMFTNGFYEKNKTNKKTQLDKALTYANIAKSQIEYEHSISNNRTLLISLAHVEYTIARIWAYKYTEEYDDAACELPFIIRICYEAVMNPFNTDDLKKDRLEKSGIVYFIRYLIKYPVEIDEKRAMRCFNELLSMYITGTNV